MTCKPVLQIKHMHRTTVPWVNDTGGGGGGAGQKEKIWCAVVSCVRKLQVFYLQVIQVQMIQTRRS